MTSGKVKRFAVFHGDNYYPCGGPRDFVGSFDSLGEAREAAMGEPRYCDPWCVIWDIETGEITRVEVEAEP